MNKLLSPYLPAFSVFAGLASVLLIFAAVPPGTTIRDVAHHIPFGPPVICGDDVCTYPETRCNCPDDCGLPLRYETLRITCHDGLDNDCDGYADCHDTDCQRPYGDIWPCFIPDGAVEIMDVLAVLDAAKGNPGCPRWCP